MDSKLSESMNEVSLGSYRPVKDPEEHKDFKGINTWIRVLRNGLLRDAKLHSLMVQVVNGFNYKAIYQVGNDTYQIVAYTPYSESKPELKAWDQIVSPSDPTVIKPAGCATVSDRTGKCEECLPGKQLNPVTGECGNSKTAQTESL